MLLFRIESRLFKGKQTLVPVKFRILRSCKKLLQYRKMSREKNRPIFTTIAILIGISFIFLIINPLYSSYGINRSPIILNGSKESIPRAEKFDINNGSKENRGPIILNGSNSNGSIPQAKKFNPQLLKNFTKCFVNANETTGGACAQELNLDQESPELIEYVRRFHIYPPSNQPYPTAMLEHGANDKRWKNLITKRVLEIIKYKENGFFIEAGAYDGVFLSNTLDLEMNYGWNGLLVEADPKPFELLQSKNRKSHLTNICLSITPFPNKITMMRHKKMGALSFNPKLFKGRHPDIKDFEMFQTSCFPLYTILRAVGVSSVDYFSMDMEGVELAVLKTFPFEKISIKILSLELEYQSKQTNAFLKGKGYQLDKFIREAYTHDQIYVHSSLSP